MLQGTWQFDVHERDALDWITNKKGNFAMTTFICKGCGIAENNRRLSHA